MDAAIGLVNGVRYGTVCWLVIGGVLWLLR